jgi:hypothetical protein
MERREFMRRVVAGGVAAAMPRALFAATDGIKLTVYKTPTCGCCTAWVGYMKDQGFDVTAIDMADLSNIKSSWGVPEKLQSCHTALSGSYVIEGHVPADLVKKMVSERPKIVGLAVPGMPEDAPGMGSGKTPYDVMSWTKVGKPKVFAKR